ncbi:non-specific serine/threonine protein kinase [Micromonospora sp. ATCC 39149]|nr:non-specific serine/threonine protein kinase [Micromonospora sp. ATCC 39149]
MGSPPSGPPSTRWPPRWPTGSGTRPAARFGPASGWWSRPPTRSPTPSPPRWPRTRPMRRASRAWRRTMRRAPRSTRAAGGWSSGSRPPTSRACSSTPVRSGGPRTPFPGSRAGSTPPRKLCSPSWAGPAGSGRSWTPPCVRRRRRRWSWTSRARTGSCARARRCCTPPGSGCCCRAGGGRPSSRLGARLQARSRTAPGTVAAAGGGFGLDALVDYRWEVSLGDESISAEELAALAELKTPLVRLRGRWVELDPARLAAGLRLLRSAGELTVADLLRLGLAESDSADALPVLEVSADGALGDLLAGQAERRLTPLDPPPAFAGTLRPYQRRGLAWLAFLQSLGLGGVLADDMGLGKTVQLLALLAGDPPDAGPTLLVCPMSLVGNWQREAARFTPKLRVHVHHGAERARGDDFVAAVHAADLVLTTYSVAARDAVDLAGIDWHRVVVDEAQAIKNASTRQAEAVRALPARHRIAVTGTPVENRLADLWSIMQFANPGLLGPAASFRKAYAEPIERHGDAEAAERLRRMTGPFVLRRLKTDSSVISDLPEKLEMEVLCNLTAEQAGLYQAVVDDMLARIESSDGIERRGLVLAAMTRLKQVCNHPAQLLRDGSALTGRSGKLARLEEILDEVLAAGEKALLFTQYAEFGGMLRGHLSARFGREVLFLHGGVGKADRDAMVTRFQSDAGPPLFVLSLKAGGTGLTLTAANHVVHVDRWWNPAVEDQATDRAFRIGQRRRVQVRKFVCAGTLEEKVAAMIAEKRSLAASVVGTGEQWVTELSTDRLRELFALEAGAVVE